MTQEQEGKHVKHARIIIYQQKNNKAILKKTSPNTNINIYSNRSQTINPTRMNSSQHATHA